MWTSSLFFFIISIDSPTAIVRLDVIQIFILVYFKERSSVIDSQLNNTKRIIRIKLNTAYSIMYTYSSPKLFYITNKFHDSVPILLAMT